MHRVAWGLFIAAVLACAGMGVLERPWSRIALGAAILLAGLGLVVAFRNGRGIERQWLADGVEGTLVVTIASAEYSDDGATRYALDGLLHTPGRAGEPVQLRGFVPIASAGAVVEGAELKVTVLDADPGAVRVHLRTDRPAAFALFRAR
ncbi:hypothetical protein [Dactylosporangium darangshiense]|uniref:DUF4131 domain-containing protein n=1 Tax=Dactylosporangium darangshiense TaxID=579108 RepID=A0ABP8DEY9_9ACTN